MKAAVVVLSVLLLCVCLPGQAVANPDAPVNIEKYLNVGFVVTLLPATAKDSFYVEPNEKHLYVKAERAEAPLSRTHQAVSGWFEFIPVFLASVFPHAPPIPFNTSCFEEYQAEMTAFTNDGATIKVTHRKKHGLLCHDSIMIASRESIHLFEFMSNGEHTTHFKWTNPDERVDIEENGFQVFFLPDGYLGSILDIWQTYQLFVSPKSFQDGIKFMEEHMNVTFETRSVENFIPDESEIMNGDYIAIFGISNTSATHDVGTSALIALGTGGHTSHAVTCLWIEGQLYVVESCGKGIIRTPYRKWMHELGPEFMATVLRLREDLQAKFNVTAAIQYFLTVEGLPYGTENFVYGWIDTANGNYPPPLNEEEIPGVLVLGDAFFPAAVNKGVLEGLSLRLGIPNLTASQVLEICDRKNISLVDIIAMPELETYVYPNPTGPRMVCDVFVLKVYKAAGVFGDLNFQATELTPKDSYQLGIFSNNWQRPQLCASDPVPGQCQISGMYWLTLPGFNSIAPYAHMNEKCGAIPPNYVRTPVGC